MHLHCEASDVQDLIGSTLDQIEERLEDHPIKVDLQDNLPLVPLDFVLMEQVLVNVIDNAVKYSQPGSPIEIKVRVLDMTIEIQIADRGVGIPPEDLARVFDKFYRVQRPDSVSGTGLGLSICKGIIDAHDGSIRAENRSGGGTIITIELPLEVRHD
jgi:two-component system, OmpR family, sensor histidine kinase KdpD